MGGLLSAGAGAAPSVPCPSFPVSRLSGQVDALQFGAGSSHETLTPVSGHLRTATAYQAITRVSFRYGGNAYTVARGAGFTLGCYGQSASHPHILYPSVGVSSGSASVSTVAADPGALKAFEALINPVGHVAQHISIDVAGEPTHQVTTVRSSGPVIDFTPELGSRAGHCIYHHDVRFTTFWNQRIAWVDMHVSVLS